MELFMPILGDKRNALYFLEKVMAKTTGKDIFNTYECLEKVCVEISEMLRAVKEQMRTEGFEPLANSIRWDTSSVLDQPTYWLPYFSQQIYRKTNDKSNKTIGVNVLLKDAKLHMKRPFVTCGIFKHIGNSTTKSDGLYHAGWATKEMDVEISSLKTTGKLSHTVYGLKAPEEITSYFLDLTTITDLESVRSLIVLPLTSMCEGTNPQDCIANIKAITLDEICAD
jgi:hypothetical protein